MNKKLRGRLLEMNETQSRLCIIRSIPWAPNLPPSLGSYCLLTVVVAIIVNQFVFLGWLNLLRTVGFPMGDHGLFRVSFGFPFGSVILKGLIGLQ